MPIYEFRCDKCHRDFEEITGSDAQAPHCPNCGSEATHRLMSASARHRSSDGGYVPSSGGGCGGCTGGNCASCGH